MNESKKGIDYIVMKLLAYFFLPIVIIYYVFYKNNEDFSLSVKMNETEPNLNSEFRARIGKYTIQIS